MLLTDYLVALGEIWSAATGRKLVALGGEVAKDGKFFDRLANGTAPRTSTFEKFLAYFRDGSNWPDNVIPQNAVDLLDRLGNIATETGESSPDIAAELIGARP